MDPQLNLVWSIFYFFFKLNISLLNFYSFLIIIDTFLHGFRKIYLYKKWNLKKKKKKINKRPNTVKNKYHLKKKKKKYKLKLTFCGYLCVMNPHLFLWYIFPMELTGNIPRLLCAFIGFMHLIYMVYIKLLLSKNLIKKNICIL